MEKENRNQKEAPEGEQTENNLGKIRGRLLFTYVFLILIAVAVVSFITINITFSVMEEKTGSLLTTLNTQMNLSISNYFDEMEENAVLAFVVPQNYLYDPTAEADGEQKDRILGEITTSIQQISVMDNFNDFAILYRDGEYAGRISDSTQKLFGEEMFEELEQSADDEKRHDGWIAGYGGDYKRLYYVKRMNENALLLLSFYVMDLDNVIDMGSDAQEVTVRIIDEDYHIVYSSQHAEIGQPLPENMVSTISDHKSVSVSDSSYMYNIKTCVGEWRLISTIPMETMLKEFRTVRVGAGLLSLVVVILSIVLARFLSVIITNPLNNMVYGLSEKAEFDLLTGIYNKITFEHYAEELIDNPDVEGDLAYFLSDVDDFKKVNDICGHSVGDRVLQKYGKILSDVYHKDLPGRIGGDEFAAIILIPPGENPYVYIGERIKNIRKRVSQIHEENADIHVSIGVAIRGDSKCTLTDLYRNADRALYETKRRGKNGYTFYDRNMHTREGDRS